jgi:hypothetical protein
MNGHLDTVKVPLSVFADINIAADNGRTPVAACEYVGSSKLAHYMQHNHLMSVTGDGDSNSDVTVSGQADHNNTDPQAALEDVTASIIL